MEETGPDKKKCQAGRPHHRPAGPSWRPKASAFLQQAVSGLKRHKPKPIQQNSTDIPSGGLFGPQLGPYSSSAAPTKQPTFGPTSGGNLERPRKRRAILSIKDSSSRIVVSAVLRTIPMHDWRLSLRRTVAPRVTGVGEALQSATFKGKPTGFSITALEVALLLLPPQKIQVGAQMIPVHSRLATPLGDALPGYYYKY
ncbi:hypothetical protein EJB05_30483, partial [Eragrostis curvula]